MKMDKTKKTKILDLGCANSKLFGKERFLDYDFNGEVIGLDYTKTEQTDVICDLNKEKLPFEDETFDIVYARHCLEHIENIFNVISEVHRVLKKGGFFLIAVPHVSSSSAMTNINHVRVFGYNTMDCFISKSDNPQIKNLKGMFKLIKKKIFFGRVYKYFGIEFLANKFPIYYTEFFSWLFPAREMHWELEK